MENLGPDPDYCLDLCADVAHSPAVNELVADAMKVPSWQKVGDNNIEGLALIMKERKKKCDETYYIELTGENLPRLKKFFHVMKRFPVSIELDLLKHHREYIPCDDAINALDGPENG